MAGRTKGFHHSAETREKMRQAALIRWPLRSPEERDRFRLSTVGRVITPEQRAKMIEGARRPEVRARMALAAHSKPPASPETREKIRQARLGKKLSEASREKVRQARIQQRFPLTDIELILRAELKKRRVAFEMHKAMFKRFQPDFVFQCANLIVQVDGIWWHQRTRNAAQDATFNQAAATAGWTVWRFTDREIQTHAAACARAIARFVRDHR